MLTFLLSMVPGTMFLSGEDIVVKKLLSRGIPERFLIGLTWGAKGLIFSGLVFLLGTPIVDGKFYTAFIATSVLNIFGQLAWYRAFKHSEVSLIAPLRLLIPVLVIGTGLLFLHERPSLWGIAGILTTVFGLWFLLSSEAAEHKRTLRGVLGTPGVLWGFLGVLSFAVSFPFDKQAVVHSSSLFMGAAVFSVVAIGNLFLFLIAGRPKEFALAPIVSLWRPMFLGVVLSSIGSVLTLYSLNFTLAAYASSVKRLQALWSVLLSGAFLKERSIGKKLLATIIMLAGVVLTVLTG